MCCISTFRLTENTQAVLQTWRKHVDAKESGQVRGKASGGQTVQVVDKVSEPQKLRFPLSGLPLYGDSG